MCNVRRKYEWRIHSRLEHVLKKNKNNSRKLWKTFSDLSGDKGFIFQKSYVMLMSSTITSSSDSLSSRLGEKAVTLDLVSRFETKLITALVLKFSRRYHSRLD